MAIKDDDGHGHEYAVDGDHDGGRVDDDDFYSDEDDGDLWHNMEQSGAEKNSSSKAEEEGGEHDLIHNRSFIIIDN